MRTYNLTRHVTLAVTLLLALLLAALFLPRRADALIRMTPAVALWRILAHEASLPVWSETDEEWVAQRSGRPWGEDVLLIHEVLLRGVERGGGRFSYVEFAQAYANRMFLPLSPVERQRHALGLPLDGNRWAGFLREDMHEPEAWTAGDWSRRRDAARFALALATETAELDMLGLEEVTPCAEPVDDWGSPRLDHERALRIGLVPVDCGPSVVNAGYARPSQIRARAAEVDVE